MIIYAFNGYLSGLINSSPHSHHILAKFISQQKRGKIGLASLPPFLYKSLNIFFKVSFKLGHLVS